MSFDLSKCERNEQGHYLCETRDGRPARVVGTDFNSKSGETLLAVITGSDGMSHSRIYYKEGRVWKSLYSDYDLVNIRKTIKQTGWVNVCQHCCPMLFLTKEAADCAACKERLACVQITIECKEGDGL